MISFCIPFYSNTDFLGRAIKSVLAQTSKDWTLFVFDDSAGSEEAKVLVEGFGDSRIRYFKNLRNLGMVGNWNQCIENAQSDLISILHADDLLMPNYCELLTEAAARYPEAAAIFCEAEIIDRNDRALFSFPDFIKRFIAPAGSGDLILQGENAVKTLLRGDFIMCPTLCYRRSKIGNERFDPRWKQVQDLEFLIRLLTGGATLVGLREVAYRYRRHENNATAQQTKSLQRFKEEVELYRGFATALPGRGFHAAATVAQRMLIIKLNLIYCMLKDVVCLRFADCGTKLKYFVRTWGAN